MPSVTKIRFQSKPNQSAELHLPWLHLTRRQTLIFCLSLRLPSGEGWNAARQRFCLRNCLIKLSTGRVVEELPLRYSVSDDSVKAKLTEDGERRQHRFKAAGGSLLICLSPPWQGAVSQSHRLPPLPPSHGSQPSLVWRTLNTDGRSEERKRPTGVRQQAKWSQKPGWFCAEKILFKAPLSLYLTA